MSEFVDGFEVLAKVGKAASIFGSSRTQRGSKYYKLAQDVAYALAKEDYAIITGSGPGLMEAANKGAKMAGGLSIGLNIQIPTEQKPNKYVDTLLDFHSLCLMTSSQMVARDKGVRVPQFSPQRASVDKGTASAYAFSITL